MAGKEINLKKTRKLLFDILRPETSFFYVAIAYGLGIGLLTLAVPIAVQTLINTVVNTASTRAVVILSIILFITLLLYGILSALRVRVMELYERRIYSRLTADLTLKTIQAHHKFFEGRRNTTITHRYFEVMTFQKNIPSLMVDGFALVLQLLVGFTLVSFYHPFLLAFNLIVLLMMWFIWRVLSKQAKTTAVALSNSKYETAKWLSDISSAPTFFKSSRHLRFAADKTEGMIRDYISCHAGHFNFTFSQTVFYLVLYALASSALLGLGGWLVVEEQLSVGQLVAAELIMSAVFLGISNFSTYLILYYELYGAAQKLGSVLNIPQENTATSDRDVEGDNTLVFHDVVLSQDDKKCGVDIALKPDAKYFVMNNQVWQQRRFLSSLKCYETPDSGWIQLGEGAITDYHTYGLRQAIATIDRGLIIECSILEYIRLIAPNATEKKIREVCGELLLEPTINNLPLGLNAMLSPLGYPLQPTEFLLLKVAAALLSQPKVLILNQHFDAIPAHLREVILAYIEAQPVTVLYFTTAPLPHYFDGTIQLDETSHLTPHSATKETDDEV